MITTNYGVLGLPTVNATIPKISNQNKAKETIVFEQSYRGF